MPHFINRKLLSNTYPSLLKLMQIATLVPMTSVACERGGFLTMRHIKTKGRTRLRDDTLDCLMRIARQRKLSVDTFREQYALRVADRWGSHTWTGRRNGLATCMELRCT